MKTGSAVGMNKINILFALVVLLGLIPAGIKAASPGPSTQPSTQPATQPGRMRWDKEIEAFERQDRTSAPPQGAILFVGSSGIVRWKTLTKDFPDHVVINRGFGGSTMADCLYYTDRIVIPYKPKTIVLREGANDVENPKVTVQEVAEQYAQFIKKVQAALPDTRIIILSLNPTPARIKKAAKQKELNELLKGMVAEGKNLDYVDLWTPTLGPEGKPKPELFVKDGIHNTEEGYRLWTQLIAPHLK